MIIFTNMNKLNTLSMKLLIKSPFYLFSNNQNVDFHLDSTKKTYIITLANPAKRNPLNHQLLTTLLQNLKEVNDLIRLKKIKTLLIKSQGPVFSSGHDLKQITDINKAEQIFKSSAAYCMKLNKLEIPVIAVVNGLVTAAGLQLMTSTDLVIATQKSEFGIPAIRWGVFPSTPAIELSRTISSEKKILQLLLGQTMKAQQAYTLGLINKVVKQEQLDNQVNKYVESFNKLSGDVIALGKNAFINQKNENNIEQAYKLGISAMIQNIKLQDGKQGLKAFSQKRHPHFKN